MGNRTYTDHRLITPHELRAAGSAQAYAQSEHKRERLLNKNRMRRHRVREYQRVMAGRSFHPHKAEERDNVLKVRRREQEAAREKARRWRKRRLKREATLAKEEKREKVAAEENHTVKAKEDKAAHVKGGSAEEITPAKRHGNGVRTGSLSSLKAEKDEASALLAEVMSSAADAVLEDQLHTHRELEEEETAQSTTKIA